MARITATTIILMAAITSTARAADGWEKDGSKKGVTVFTRSVPGSEVPRVKGVTTVDASTDAVWKHLSGGDSSSGSLEESEILGKCGEDCVYLYQKFGNVFIDYWYYVLEVRWEASGEKGLRTYRRTWRKTSKMSVAASGATEVEKISGSWTLEPVDGGKGTRAIYVNHVDLGSGVPPKLYSAGFVSRTYKILAKLRKAF